MTRDIVLEARNLSKQVSSPEGPLTIVRNISFTVTRGESIALVGPSGAGKSTLLALLAGLDLPSSGEVVLAGEILGALDEDGRARLRAERVGFVFQSFHLLPSLTARENVMLPLELSGRDDARTAADEMLERVGLAARARHYPRQLSGGEQQRVAIARSLANRPRLLLCDEPTGNLDIATADVVFAELLSAVRNEGVAALIATHNPDLAARMDRRMTLRDGRVV
jgi:putative ABC transport system ATP-binding protein